MRAPPHFHNGISFLLLVNPSNANQGYAPNRGSVPPTIRDVNAPGQCDGNGFLIADETVIPKMLIKQCITQINDLEQSKI